MLWKGLTNIFRTWSPILVGCLEEDQWEQASLPVRFTGLGVNQSKVIAGSAYVGSCALTKNLVAHMLGLDPSTYEPAGVSALLSAHETATGVPHDFAAFSEQKSVQQLLSTERHESIFARLKSKGSVRSQNLMLACSMPHASDWLLAPPVPGLGLGLQSDAFRTALKFRLGMRVFDAPFACPAVSTSTGAVCGSEMDVFGDHALCCNHGPSIVFRHNNVRPFS